MSWQPGHAHLRRPWRSWVPPIFGNVFCPEDLAQHLPSQQAEAQLSHRRSSLQAEAPTAYVHPQNCGRFCSAPLLVVGPDGCQLSLARQLRSGTEDNQVGVHAHFGLTESLWASLEISYWQLTLYSSHPCMLPSACSCSCNSP